MATATCAWANQTLRIARRASVCFGYEALAAQQHHTRLLTGENECRTHLADDCCLLLPE